MIFMHLFNRSRKSVFLALALLAVAAILIRYAAHHHFPILEDNLSDKLYGNIAAARPLTGYQDLVVVFVDTTRFNPGNLAHRIAQAGAAAAIFDIAHAVQALSSGENPCLNPDRIKETMGILSTWAHASQNTPRILAGIGDGGLLPFLFAVSPSGSESLNLSVAFSVNLPQGASVCSPMTTAMTSGHPVLTSSPALTGRWSAVWTDQPDDRTALFVRGLSDAKTAIMPYDTPLDTVTVHEIQKLMTEKSRKPASPLPVVEVPAARPNDTVTLFYSGDGGWRDLDRDVAGQLAGLGYPVVGVDTLRYFWSSKSPEEAANDLAVTLSYYRKTWGAKNFILAGFSFGADILPAVYNRLSEPDRENVPLLVLLSIGKTADFEIHVSGWVGKSSSDVPILPELSRIPGNKILCIIGQEEKADSVCDSLSIPGARLIVLPGGHHFDQDYPRLAIRIIEIFHQIGLK